MPDISMCQNRQCPSAGECWRFNATPWEQGQLYGSFTVEEGEDKCFAFWSMPETEEEEYRLDNDLKVFLEEYLGKSPKEREQFSGKYNDSARTIKRKDDDGN